MNPELVSQRVFQNLWNGSFQRHERGKKECADTSPLYTLRMSLDLKANFKNKTRHAANIISNATFTPIPQNYANSKITYLLTNKHKKAERLEATVG